MKEWYGFRGKLQKDTLKQESNLSDLDSLKRHILEGLKSGKPLNGKNGLLTPFIKEVLETALEGEIEAHMASEGQDSKNRRNGKSTKIVKSGSSQFELSTHRDRDGSFGAHHR